MNTSERSLVDRVAAAVDRHGKAKVARAADVTRATLYAFLESGQASPPTRHRLEDALRALAGDTPAGAPAPSGEPPPAPPVPAGRHEPSFWEGRLTSAADTVDAVYAMLGVVRADLRGVLASGVLHGAPQAAPPPAPLVGQGEWRPMEPPGPEAAARAHAIAEQARQTAKDRQSRNAAPPARRRRAGG